ncbi:MAG: DUF58 domain-containing protein [Microthrixaceae bacterium]
MFGLVLVVLLGLAWFYRPQVSDPSVTGMVFGGLAGALVLGLFWPSVMIRLLNLQIIDSPGDLITGELASVEVQLKGLASGLSISIAGSTVTATDMASPSGQLVPLAMAHRGVYDELEFEVGSDAPFGVMWAMRRFAVKLPKPLYVGPVSDLSDVDSARVLDNTSPVESIRGEVLGETVRSVRHYVTGDPAHLVHWPTTARTGQLVVREFEPPSDDAVAIVVHLGSVSTDGSGMGFEAREIAARRASGMVENALARGVRVVLCTAQMSGQVSREVADMTAARRQLAAAIEGEPAPAPFGWPVVQVTS